MEKQDVHTFALEVNGVAVTMPQFALETAIVVHTTDQLYGERIATEDNDFNLVWILNEYITNPSWIKQLLF